MTRLSSTKREQLYDAEGGVPCVHYVGFRDDRYWNAYRIWGGPSIIHRWWDKRAQRDIGPNDIVIFAEGDWTQPPSPFNAPDIDESFL